MTARDPKGDKGHVRTPRRSFLFLQTIASPFFRRLGAALVRDGHRVVKVNYCQGDALYWSGPETVAFTGRLEDLPRFYERLCAGHDVGDIVLFGDCRPIHRPAVAHARSAGLRLWVFEEGYLRPDWITLEHDGVNGNSRLLRGAAFFRSRARDLSPVPPPIRVGAGLGRRIAFDIAYNVTRSALAFRFPHYRTHRPYPIWHEYATWVARLARLRAQGRRADRIVTSLLREEVPYFLFPLQLDSDFQIRVHTPFGGMLAAIEHVIDAFAADASRETKLVIKNHPLDNGMIAYRKHIARLAKARGVGARVQFLEGGDLDTLMDRARGVVVVNSTVGLSALLRGRPVAVLGTALYDIDGLTNRDGLAGFWRNPRGPDRALLDDFVRVLTHDTQVNGNYYTARGIEVGVVQAAARLTGETSHPRGVGTRCE